MNSTPIFTVGQLKKQLTILEKHQCIGSNTPITVLGAPAALQFDQERDEVTLKNVSESDSSPAFNNEEKGALND